MLLSIPVLSIVVAAITPKFNPSSILCVISQVPFEHTLTVFLPKHSQSCGLIFLPFTFQKIALSCFEDASAVSFVVDPVTLEV